MLCLSSKGIWQTICTMNKDSNELKDNKLVLIIGGIILALVVFFGLNLALDAYHDYQVSQNDTRPQKPGAISPDSPAQ